jgi:hypothetical protein
VYERNNSGMGGPQRGSVGVSVCAVLVSGLCGSGGANYAGCVASRYLLWWQNILASYHCRLTIDACLPSGRDKVGHMHRREGMVVPMDVHSPSRG